MILDFHTHCFPDALAPRAIEVLTKNCAAFGLVPNTDGTASGARRLLSHAGIDGAVVCNIATNERQETNVNSFAIAMQEKKDFFFPLGSLHPDSQRKEAELDRLAAAGIRGIKIHPDYVGIPISDPRFDEIFSLLEERGMFVVAHTGVDPISPDLVHATPKMLAEIIRRHPRLTLIAAHMGGYTLSREVLDTLVGTRIYLDTSLCARRVEEWDTLRQILKEHDSDRILFASDTPWSDPAAELAFILGSPLSEKTKEKILSGNALRLLTK